MQEFCENFLHKIFLQKIEILYSNRTVNFENQKFLPRKYFARCFLKQTMVLYVFIIVCVYMCVELCVCGIVCVCTWLYMHITNLCM